MKITRENNAVTLMPDGRLDSTTAGQFELELNRELDQKPEQVIIDLTEVDYISSKGLRVLVAAYKKMNGKPITILGANESVMEVFKLSGLLKIFKIADAPL